MSYRKYFISPDGSDSYSGTYEKPFKTLSKLNQMKLYPGDHIYLEGGKTHEGSLVLLETRGTFANPVIITSYGENPAMIDAKNNGGILLLNSSWITIRNLEVVGSGYPKIKTWNVLL
jgi:nitrous oxidase accessory protein NosD